jgi:hypothetical protein
MEEIINKVANSTLEVFDLEDYYPLGNRVQIDISQWLYEGFLLKEIDFRESLKNYNWSQYQDNFVAINCSTDAVSSFRKKSGFRKFIRFRNSLV